MQRLDALFRFSFYLCLMISTVALAFTTWGQLADTLFFFIPMIVLVGVAYWLNDRWTLSVRASNILAVSIIFAWFAFLGLTLRGNRINSELVEVEMVRLALPCFAPLIGILLLAKLFRPKSVRDYWTIHLMGLVQMVLACVLAMTNKLDRDAPLFPLAVLAYLLTLVWTLRNFNLYSLHMSPVAGRGRRQPAVQAGSPRVSLGIGSSLGWFVLTLLLGLVVFFTVPRGATSLTTGTFGSLGQAAQTGFKPSMDLGGEGQLQVSEELVFRASVRDSQGKSRQLGLSPRWRGVSCVEYDNGRWRPVRMDNTGHSRSAGQPGPGELLVAYELDIRKVRQAGPVSTEEVPNRVMGEIPLFALERLVVDLRRPGVGAVRVGLDPSSPSGDWTSVMPHFSREEGCVSATLQQHRPTRNVFYHQVIAESDVGQQEWTQTVSADFAESMTKYYELLAKVPARLFATSRIKQIAEEMLTAEKVPLDAPAKEKARALERRLLSTGGFGYSLNRRRVDPKLDPNEDFLLNVKEGTCERFASALALLLRSVGVPARIVIGFRGADWNSVGDFYEVRELHAHAWVEAVTDTDLDPRQLRGDREEMRGPRRIQWISLDPTPSVEIQNRDQSLFLQNVSFARMLWEFFILDFTGDLQRQRFLSQLNKLGWDRLEAALRRYGTVGLILWGIAFLLSCALAVLLLRMFQRWLRYNLRMRKEFAWLPRVPFFRRFLNLFMRRWRLKPVPTQTAAEYARQAEVLLRREKKPADIAEIPSALAQHYYSVRFGEEPLEQATLATAAALEALARQQPQPPAGPAA